MQAAISQPEDPLLRGLTEQKLAEDKPSGKRPSEVKVTVMIRMLTTYFE
jgi:hypothetical protein